MENVYQINIRGSPVTYSQSEYDLASRLIITGRTFAANDSRTRNLVNYMLEHGYKSMTPQAIEQRKEMNQIKQNETKPTYTDSLGQGMSIDPNKAGLLNKAIEKGDIQGFSGTTLNPTEIAKKSLLENAGFISKTPTTGEYYKATTPEGQKILNQVIQTVQVPKEALKSKLPPTYASQDISKINPRLLGAGGTAEPITASDMANVISGVYGLGRLGLIKGSQVVLSKPITEINQKIIDRIIPRQDSGFAMQGLPQQVGRGGLFVLTSPITGYSYATELGKGLATSPIQTTKGLYDYTSKNPYEVTTVTFGEPVKTKIENTAYDVYNYNKLRGMEELKLASSEIKPFIRQNEVVFMKRFEGIKLKEPSSIINYFKGYKKGQFLEKQSRIISPEVEAFYKGLKEITYYEPVIKDNKIIRFEKITKQTERFPYEESKNFKKYFENLNKKLYGLPKTSKLPIDVRNKVFGYSATSSGNIIKNIGEAGQFYSGKGISVAFLRLMNKYDLSLKEQINMGNKPFVYASYGNKAVVVPKAYEIKVPNPYEIGGKPIKKYIFPETETKPGEFYIPTNKPEVQAVVYGGVLPLRNKFYFKLGGRRIPIQENIIIDNNIAREIKLQNKELSKLIPEKARSSVLPYKENIISQAVKSIYKIPVPSKSIESSIKEFHKSIESVYRTPMKSIKSSSGKSESKISSSVLSKSDISNYNNTSKSISNSISKISKPSISYEPFKTTSSKITSSQVSSRPYVQTPPKSPPIKSPPTTKPPIKSPPTYRTPFTTIKPNVPPIKPKPFKEEQQYKKQKNLGDGYYVYGKTINTNTFNRINNVPLTRARVQDIGSYYVSNTLARSYKIVKANKKAEQDYQYVFIPDGYFKSKEAQIREYRIKQGQKRDIGEIFIQKSKYLLNTEAEKRQIKEFQRQVSKILK